MKTLVILLKLFYIPLMSARAFAKVNEWDQRRGCEEKEIRKLFSVYVSSCYLSHRDEGSRPSSMRAGSCARRVCSFVYRQRERRADCEYKFGVNFVYSEKCSAHNSNSILPWRRFKIVYTASFQTRKYGRESIL